MTEPNYLRCGSIEMCRVTAEGGGQVGWICDGCKAFYKEGNYIDVMRKNLNSEGEYFKLHPDENNA